MEQSTRPPAVIARDLLGVFFLSLALLVFELAFSKIVHVQHYGNLGYVVIGTALFGFAFAGVLLAIVEPIRSVSSQALVPWTSLFSGLSILLAYLVTSTVPLNFLEFFDRPILTLFYLALWYLSLTLPFLFAGLAIASLLGRQERGVSTLYGADLLGAGFGAIGALVLMSILGGAGVVWLSAGLAVLSAAIFASASAKRLAVSSLVVVAVIAVVGMYVAPAVDVVVHTPKRGFAEDRDRGRIIKTQWSAISRIDVADRLDSRRIWFDAGSMQSHMFRDDGTLSNLPREVTEGSGPLPYRLRHRRNVLVIASAGGREVMQALANGAEHVVAVEIDPAVCDLVRNEFNDYLGGLFQRPDVELVNAEGRSYVKRSETRYDVIQQVSAYSLEMLSLGAAAHMDSYLATVEAICDYYLHLTDDGVLCISREHGVRLLATVLAALERLGVEPEGRIYMERAKNTYNHHMILLRKNPFPPNEMVVLSRHIRNQGRTVYVAPPGLRQLLGRDWRDPEPDVNGQRVIDEIYRLDAEERDAFIGNLGYSAKAVFDDKPFYNRFNHFLQPIPIDATLPEEILDVARSQGSVGPVPLGDVPPLTVLVEAILLSGLIIHLPLRRFSRVKRLSGLRGLTLAYFFLLGLGFIAIEVILLQRCILFVGSPMIAMAVVLGSLLVWAGIGSALLSPGIVDHPRRLIWTFGAIAILAVAYAIGLEPMFNAFLHQSLPIRCMIGALMLLPLGLLMGVPFPVGLRYAHRQNRRVVAWGWALNGYATVVGTTAVSIVIPMLGYRSMFLVGGLVYLVAGACISALVKRSKLVGGGVSG